MSKIEAHIKDWIEKVSKVRPELGGFSVCPYASKAKYLVVETLAEDIMPISGYDVVFYVVEDYFDLESVQFWVNYYNNLHEEWLFFEDCASYNTYIGDVQTNNSKYNLILMQDKEHLRKHREKLAKTGYYHHWNDAYLKEILGDDYKILKK
jgi:hypothetical protein